MRKVVKILLTSFTMILLICFNASAKGTTYYNKVSPRALLQATQSSDDFIQLPSKTNVSLDKMWTIKFSSDISIDKIEGIVVQKDAQFVPVNITVSDKDKITVQPLSSYSGNSAYSLKIFLNNGKKYNMDFTTENSSRNADTANNNLDYKNASTINLGETITGAITKTAGQDSWVRSVRWYKLFIGKDCNLNLTLQQNDDKPVDMYVYGINGDNDNSIKEYSNNDKSAVNLKQGLTSGTYYIKITSSYEGTFKLNVDYRFNNDGNDEENNDVYLSAKSIDVNESTTGHLGYAYETTEIDKADFYKVIIDKDGTLNIDVDQKDGNPINTYLYGKDGDNNYSFNDYYDSKSVRHLSYGLEPGTYYIKVSSNYAGSYGITTSFTENKENNDGTDNRVYIHANTINLGGIQTGHIGYLNESNSKNENDWYKIVLNSDAKLNLNVTSNEGKIIHLSLYGEDGDNDSPIDSYGYSDKSIINLSDTLKAGTYFIKVNSSDTQGYKLTATTN